uniref:Uncharacterized protein n=1 Tax=Oryza meridionalis TaxID=40149 RepID=A0A0E0EZ37_9ORYZ
MSGAGRCFSFLAISPSSLRAAASSEFFTRAWSSTLETSERAAGAESENARRASSGPGKREMARARRPGDAGAESRRARRSEVARSGRRRRARREATREKSGREPWRRG